jgi:CRISPR system Cascade subunit CasA
MQGFNLIREPWIPVRHRSGRRSWRAPFEIFGEPDDPVVAIASARADLDGGLVQLLIGLLHAAIGPERDRDWERWARTGPPDAAALRGLLEPFADAFELLGPGPRFYQDPSVAAYCGDDWPVEKLLADLGLDPGPDHFARSGSVGQLCLACAAAALATLQAAAPPGGRGHLASLRGVGPLTTLVVPAAKDADLWRRLWLNVVPLRRLRAGWDPEPPASADIFPWLSPPRTEPIRAPEVAPLGVHPLQVFFSMPRRIWLGAAEPGSCGICGRDSEVITGYQTRPNGNRYAPGVWIHPLSPYRRKEELWWTVKGDENGLGYRNWLGLVLADPGGAARPALPVQLLHESPPRSALAGGVVRLWAFGYALDNIKTVAFNDGLVPLREIPDAIAVRYAAEIGRLLEGARSVEFLIRRAFKSLVARRPQDVKNEPGQVSERFWQETESSFFDHAFGLLQVLDRNGRDLEAASLETRQNWHRRLCACAFRIFDSEVEEADFRAADPGQVARAFHELRRALYGKKLKTALGLPVAEEKKAKGGRKKP